MKPTCAQIYTLLSHTMRHGRAWITQHSFYLKLLCHTVILNNYHASPEDTLQTNSLDPNMFNGQSKLCILSVLIGGHHKPQEELFLKVQWELWLSHRKSIAKRLYILWCFIFCPFFCLYLLRHKSIGILSITCCSQLTLCFFYCTTAVGQSGRQIITTFNNCFYLVH